MIGFCVAPFMGLEKGGKALFKNSDFNFKLKRIKRQKSNFSASFATTSQAE